MASVLVGSSVRYWPNLQTRLSSKWPYLRKNWMKNQKIKKLAASWWGQKGNWTTRRKMDKPSPNNILSRPLWANVFMTITSLNSITLQHYAAEVFDPLGCSKRSSVCGNVMGHSRFVGRRSHAAAALLFQEEVAEKREVGRQAVKAPGSRTGRHYVSSLINAMSVQSTSNIMSGWSHHITS